MSELIQNGITFNNIVLENPTTIASKITRSSQGAIAAGKGKPVVDAVSIDWNGAEVEENVVINTTGQLISWIKSAIGSGNSQQIQDVVNTLRFITAGTYTSDEVDSLFISKDELNDFAEELSVEDINGISEAIDEAIAAVVDAAPEELNTLRELAAALNDKADAIAALNGVIATKANIEDVYTKSEVNAKIGNLGNAEDAIPAVEPVEGVHYTQEEIDAAAVIAAKTTADWKVEPVEAQPAIYAFESWNNSSKEIKYGEGKVKVIEMRAGGATIEVIENNSTDPNAADFVGQQFNIPTALATNDPIQLYTLDNVAVDIWVTVELIQEAQEEVPGVPYTQEELDAAATIASKTVDDWKVEPVKGQEEVPAVPHTVKSYIEKKINEIDLPTGEFATKAELETFIEEVNEANEVAAEALVQLNERVENIQLTPGATGAQGPQGPKGDTGAAGEAGTKGDKGDTGADGKSAYELYRETVVEKEAQPAIYAFESWNNSSKEIKYGEGRAKVIEMRAGGATIEVIENNSTDPNAADFVGQQFNIATALATNDPIQLYTLDNVAVDIWVTVELVSEAQEAVVAMTQSEWLESLKGEAGVAGAAGAQGIQGPQGAQGIQGLKGDTGEAGPKGDTGEAGPKGDTGTFDASELEEYATKTYVNEAIQEVIGGAPETLNTLKEIADKFDELGGITGVQGDKGETGDKGATGDKGETGDKGLTGDKGPDGDKGQTGDHGAVGPTGAEGPQGPQGDKGETGDKGATGDKGETGDKGPTGDTGQLDTSILEEYATKSGVAELIGDLPNREEAGYEAVPSGETLETGETYYTSDTGAGEFQATGNEESDGTNYFTYHEAIPYKDIAEAIAENERIIAAAINHQEELIAHQEELIAVIPAGATGATGPKGEDGAIGSTGATGATGKSAYEIAQEGGFTGTPEEWIASLKGEPGKDGTMSFNDLTEEQKATLKGDTGATGATGADGITPHIGENGNWFIGDTDTNVKAQGENGATGATGATGADGITPHIGENGNWFIGDTDTNVKAQGENGATGATGATGPKGDTGTFDSSELEDYATKTGVLELIGDMGNQSEAIGTPGETGYVPAVPYTNVMDVITDNEEVTAAALVDLQSKYTALINALVAAGITGISELQGATSA